MEWELVEHHGGGGGWRQQTNKQTNKHRRFYTKAHNQWNGGLLSTIVGEDNGDNTENMLEHNQWSYHIIGYYTSNDDEDDQ